MDTAGQPEGAVTAFLEAAGRGDAGAQERLWSAVYEELRDMADRLMARERGDHTLQPTALVHEAYARLVGDAPVARRGRAYFFAAAAQAMRRILIEHGRRRRGQAALGDRLSLTGLGAPDDERSLGALDEALEALAAHDRRVFDVVMLRFFAGRSVEVTAETLDLSPRTVKRCWNYGRAWLFRQLEAASP